MLHIHNERYHFSFNQDSSKTFCNIKLSPTLVTCNVKDSLKQMLQFITSVGYAPKDLIVIAPYPPNLPIELITDITWLKESLCCLVSDTSKYSDDGILFMVKMVVVDGINFIEFIVKDRGRTLSEEKLRYMFKPPVQRERGSVGGIYFFFFHLV